MKQTLRSISLCAAAVILLLALAGNLMAVPPTCPSTGLRINSWSGTLDGQNVTITATTPKDGPICNGACCQTFMVSGLPLNWTLTGAIQSKFIFTTECKNGQPVPPQVIDTFNINFTSDGVNPFTQQICYPATSAWPSFEIHIDASLLVENQLGHVATFVGANLPFGVPGFIGPGIGGNTWDPVCYNTNCTPGFWKNHCNTGCHKDLTWPGGYLPTTTFDSVFPSCSGVVGSGVTLLDALNTGGGGLSAMIRQCSAALLNSAYAAFIGSVGGSCVVFAQAEPVSNVINKVDSACSGSVTFANAQAFCESIAADSLCPFDGPWLGTNSGSQCTGGIACNPNSP